MPRNDSAHARTMHGRATLIAASAAVIGAFVWLASPDAGASLQATAASTPAAKPAGHTKLARHVAARPTRSVSSRTRQAVSLSTPHQASVAPSVTVTPQMRPAHTSTPTSQPSSVAPARKPSAVRTASGTPTPVRATATRAPLHPANIAPAGTPLTASTCASAYPELTLADQWLFDALNTERLAHGRPALRWDPRLHTSACLHNTVMANADTLSHQLTGESGLGARVTAQGVHWSIAAENIGWYTDLSGSGIPAATWINTDMMNEGPGGDHYDNIMSPANYVGVSVVLDSVHGKVWVTEDFAGE